MTNVDFSGEEINLLNKGFKYNLVPEDNKQLREYRGVECELALNNIDNFEKYLVSQNIKNHPAEKPSSHLSREMNVFTLIQNKSKENNIIFTKADEGNSVVVIPKEQYIQKTLEFLEFNNVQKRNFDPTNHYQKMIKMTIKEPSIFNDEPSST